MHCLACVMGWKNHWSVLCENEAGNADTVKTMILTLDDMCFVVLKRMSSKVKIIIRHNVKHSLPFKLNFLAVLSLRGVTDFDWPSISCGLTLLDLFLWGYLKERLATIPKIKDAVAKIEQKTFLKEWYHSKEPWTAFDHHISQCVLKEKLDHPI